MFEDIYILFRGKHIRVKWKITSKTWGWEDSKKQQYTKPSEKYPGGYLAIKFKCAMKQGINIKIF